MNERLFGRYRLIERLGIGGWAEVWRAWDEAAGQSVALKRLHPHIAQDPDARVRLRHEAAAVRSIHHPAVVPLRELIEEDDQAALILDYVDGEPLSQVIAGGPLPRDTALAIAGQVADGLAAAHRAGVVHRDVKPSNVLIDRQGQAHLTDFGIAQSADSGTLLTGTGNVVGTLRYLAPEVLRGEPASAASDVWALAVMTWELVEGHPPFQGVIPSELVAEEASPPPPSLAAGPGVGALLARALDPDPAARPADAGEFADGLRAAAADLDGATAVIPIAVAAPAAPSSIDDPAALTPVPSVPLVPEAPARSGDRRPAIAGGARPPRHELLVDTRRGVLIAVAGAAILALVVLGLGPAGPGSVSDRPAATFVAAPVVATPVVTTPAPPTKEPAAPVKSEKGHGHKGHG